MKQNWGYCSDINPLAFLRSLEVLCWKNEEEFRNFPRKAFECCKEKLMRHSSDRWRNLKTGKDVRYGGSAPEVSAGNKNSNMNRARAYSGYNVEKIGYILFVSSEHG